MKGTFWFELKNGCNYKSGYFFLCSVSIHFVAWKKKMFTASISLKLNFFDSNFRQFSYRVLLSTRELISVKINSIRTFDNSAFDTNFRHEKQSSLDSNFRIEPSTRISIPQFEFKWLTNVQQLGRLSKVDSELLSKVSVKCWQRKFQSNVSVKSWHQMFQSKFDTEYFSQVLTAKVSVKSWERKCQSKVDTDI